VHAVPRLHVQLGPHVQSSPHAHTVGAVSTAVWQPHVHVAPVHDSQVQLFATFVALVMIGILEARR